MSTIAVKKEEYQRLKKLEKSFGELFDYFAYLSDISKARKEVEDKKVFSQEKVFKKLKI